MDIYNAEDILFPVGSVEEHVNITWSDSLNFDNHAFMKNPCGAYEVQFKYPVSLVATILVENEPNKGVILSLPSLEES